MSRKHNNQSNPNLLERNRNRIVGVTVGGVVLAALGLGLEGNTKPGASTKAAIVAELGHMPAGIKSVKPTEDPNIQKVHYEVQPDDTMLSQVAANLHPMSANQDIIDESAQLETYLPKADSGKIYSGEALDVYIDTKTGKILAKPKLSEAQEAKARIAAYKDLDGSSSPSVKDQIVYNYKHSDNPTNELLGG